MSLKNDVSYKKIASIKRLIDMGLNIHHQWFPRSFLEFLDIVLNDCRQHCTVRTDSYEKSDDLPFYIIKPCDSLDRITEIWDECQERHYRLIVSNGIWYDSVQLYNMVVKMRKNGDFSFEASDLKVPLRHMYRDNVLSVAGNVCDDIAQWQIFNNRQGLDRTIIKKDLAYIYKICNDYNLFDRWVELTRYPKPVGMRNKNIVFWEVK